MVINWYGEGCFKIQSGNITILTDPFSSDTGLTPPRFKADITIQTATDYPLPYERTPGTQQISGPGEYEVKGVEIFGWAIAPTKDKLSSIYRFHIEDIAVGLLGHLPDNLDPSLLEKLGAIDILIVPAGGAPYAEASTIASLIKQMNPRIVLASFFKIPGLKRKSDDIKVFLKEIGQDSKPQEKLTIKKKDLPLKTEVMVLTV